MMAYAINSEVIDLMLCFVRLLKNGSLFLDVVRKVTVTWDVFLFSFLFQIQEYQTTQTKRKLNVSLLNELLGEKVCVTVMEPIKSFKCTQIDWMMRAALC